MTATIIGDVRLYAADASLSRKDIIYGDVSTVLLALGAADPRLCQIVPYSPGAVLKEDDVLIVSTKSTAAGSVDNTATHLYRIPVTIKNMTTGIVRQAFLGVTDFTLMDGTAWSTTDVLSPAGVWTDICKYTVKAQERLILGHKMAENSRIYMIFTVT